MAIVIQYSKSSTRNGHNTLFFFFFFFLNQQFITRLAVEDRGSYFRNYVQSKQTNMKLEKGKGKGENRMK